MRRPLPPPATFHLLQSALKSNHSVVGKQDRRSHRFFGRRANRCSCEHVVRQGAKMGSRHTHRSGKHRGRRIRRHPALRETRFSARRKEPAITLLRLPVPPPAEEPHPSHDVIRCVTADPVSVASQTGSPGSCESRQGRLERPEAPECSDGCAEGLRLSQPAQHGAARRFRWSTDPFTRPSTFSSPSTMPGMLRKASRTTSPASRRRAFPAASTRRTRVRNDSAPEAGWSPTKTAGPVL